MQDRKGLRLQRYSCNTAEGSCYKGTSTRQQMVNVTEVHLQDSKGLMLQRYSYKTAKG